MVCRAPSLSRDLSSWGPRSALHDHVGRALSSLAWGIGRHGFDIAHAPALGRQVLIVDHLDHDQAALRALLITFWDAGQTCFHRLRDESSGANTARRLIEYVFE